MNEQFVSSSEDGRVSGVQQVIREGGSAPFRRQEKSEAVGQTPPPGPGSARGNGLFLPCPNRAKHPTPSPAVFDRVHTKSNAKTNTKTK